MSETTAGDQVSAGQNAQEDSADTAGKMEAEVDTLDAIYAPESPADVGAKDGETAREVAAAHLSRLMYTPVNDWSTYVFHENDPHPFGASRQRQGRG